ncbi:hypothetical protein P7B02_17795 [Caulobacter segnis]|uniref:hypothetical protein n=1 Tax=Caulobacter segnis TaxID=88688 RepID=UPI0024100F20|nr:hypothetical protein [Caulobacter segnis]MDG2523385.1 hypothetical protein [Caulobacter segnis]
MSLSRLAALSAVIASAFVLQGCLAVAAGGAVVGATGAVVGGAAKMTGKAVVGTGKMIVPGDGRDDEDR